MKEENIIDKISSHLQYSPDIVMSLSRYSLGEICKEYRELEYRLDRSIAFLEKCGIDEKMMENCSIYDVNGIELMKILKGEEDINENI